MNKAIEEIGVKNVAQVVTNNDASCKCACQIIEAKFPHVVYSGCNSSCVGSYFRRHRRIGLGKQDHRKVKGNIIFNTNHCKSQALCLKFSKKLKV
jgi:hypothetical protein